MFGPEKTFIKASLEYKKQVSQTRKSVLIVKK